MDLQLELLLPSSFSNSCCSTSDEEDRSYGGDSVDEALIENKSDSPRPSNITLFMSYRQFRDVLDLMDSSEQLPPIIEEPELENWLESSIVVPHRSEPQYSTSALYTRAARWKDVAESNLSVRTLSGSSVNVKSSATCCFVWLKTFLKWKSRRNKKFE